MNKLEITSSSEKGLRAEAALGPDTLDVCLTGTADMNVRPQLESFLSDVHAAAARTGVAAVNVDISGLEFINSSCLKSFVTWMTTAQTMNAARYMITFLFQAQFPRQARSFSALASMAGDSVRVVPKPE